MRYLFLTAAAIVAFAAAPRVSAAQQMDTSHTESPVKRKAKNTAKNAGEGVKHADSTVGHGAYKAGTAVKNVFRGKKGDKPVVDSAGKHPER